MQNVHQSKFLEISHILDNQRLVIEWLAPSEEMTEEDFKAEIQSEAEKIETYQPAQILARTTKMGFIITPELQEWHNEVIFPKFKSVGVTKLAIVLSEDIFSQISIEQLIEDNKIANFTTQYFDREEVAVEWLQA